MKYWPLWMVVENPALAPDYAQELRNFYRKAPSEAAYYAAMATIRNVPAFEAPNLSVVESEGAPSRRIFARHPESTEWLRLERTCIMDDGDDTYIHTDALH